MASLKRHRAEKWTAIVRYGEAKFGRYEYDTPDAAVMLASRMAGRGFASRVEDPNGKQIATLFARDDKPRKIDSDPNLGPNLQRAAKARKTKKRTLTRRKV